MSNLYRVGDEFEGPAALMSKFIGQVKRLGGEVRIEGKRAIITSLPYESEPETKVPVEYVTEEPEEVVEAPAPVVEEPVVEEPVVEEPVVEIEEEHVPKRRGRSRKVEVEPDESLESEE